jgi:hypothetical protein
MREQLMSAYRAQLLAQEDERAPRPGARLRGVEPRSVDADIMQQSFAEHNELTIQVTNGRERSGALVPVVQLQSWAQATYRVTMRPERLSRAILAFAHADVNRSSGKSPHLVGFLPAVREADVVKTMKAVCTHQHPSPHVAAA